MEDLKIVYLNGTFLYCKHGKYYADSIINLLQSDFRLGNDSIEIKISGIELSLFNVIRIAKLTAINKVIVGSKIIKLLKFLRRDQNRLTHKILLIMLIKIDL